MFIQLQPQYLTIWELELELLAVEVWIVLVDDTVVIGTDDNDVRGVVIQQRPVHRLLQYESIVVIHQSYISVLYYCLLLIVFLGILLQRRWCYYFPVSTFIWPNATDNTLFFQFGHDTLYLSFRKRTHRCQFFCGYG